MGPGVAGLAALLRAANGRRKRCVLQVEINVEEMTKKYIYRIVDRGM
jgi:hypothetical protein